MIRFSQSAFDHGITEEDIDFVFRSSLTVWCSNGQSRRGYERAMLVGFDRTGALIEVAVELIPGDDGEAEDQANFYHAMKATPQWCRQYERNIRG